VSNPRIYLSLIRQVAPLCVYFSVCMFTIDLIFPLSDKLPLYACISLFVCLLQTLSFPYQTSCPSMRVFLCLYVYYRPYFSLIRQVAPLCVYFSVCMFTTDLIFPLSDKLPLYACISLFVCLLQTLSFPYQANCSCRYAFEVLEKVYNIYVYIHNADMFVHLYAMGWL